MAEIHTIQCDKVRVYRCETGNNLYCSSYMNGKEHRKCTKEDSLSKAKEFAEDWYLTLRGKLTSGELKIGKTFAQASAMFLQEFEADTMGERNPKCLKNHKNHVRIHLILFFGKLGLSEFTTTKILEYRLARMQSTYGGKHPAAGTIQKEIHASDDSQSRRTPRLVKPHA